MKASTFTQHLPIKKLNVWRTLSTGSKILVGQLAYNKDGVFFQYNNTYLNTYFNLSPFLLKFDSSIQPATNKKLHSLFEDCLPDGWGLLLIDRWFEQSSLQNISSLDKLALISRNTMGALSFEPCVDLEVPSTVQLAHLNRQIHRIYQGQMTQAFESFLAGGSAAGMRPKIQVYIDKKSQKKMLTQADKNTEAYLIKFTSRHLPLQHEETLCEAAYLKLAAQAGIACCQWKLIPDAKEQHSCLALKRFDCTLAGGRYHMQSLAGLIGVNFRLPLTDYTDLIRVSMKLCQQPSAGQEQFRRAVFNLFALNHDDHAKNWSFLQDDKGQWSVAPFYDVTYSPSAHGEHMCSFEGYGQQPSIKAMQKLAHQANLTWPQGQKIIQQCVQVLSNWAQVSKQLGLSLRRQKQIEKKLNLVYQQNKALLGEVKSLKNKNS